MLSLGIDLVEVARMERLLDRWGPERLRRLFTEDELAYALSARRLTASRLATRFAAKEAFRKAIGCAAPFPAIEVVMEEKRPCLFWQGRSYLVSLTHTSRYAVAVVAVETTPSRPPSDPSGARAG